MKRRMIAVLLGIALAAGLVLGGRQLFRAFVTDRVTDKGGMENPWAVEEPEKGPSGEELTENTDKES